MWLDKTKLILIKTQIEVVVEVDVELGNFRLFLRLVGGCFFGCGK